MEQTTVSSRIPESLNESLEIASQSRGVFRSEIIRRAIRYYIEENPDDLQVLRDSAAGTSEDVIGFPSEAVCSHQSVSQEE